MTGSGNYNSNAKQSRAIRDSLSSQKKKRLTIHEYCIYEEINFDSV